jgi:hypothetical protein
MDDDVFSIFFVGGRERERKWGQETNFFFCRIMVVCVIPWNPSIVLLASCFRKWKIIYGTTILQFTLLTTPKPSKSPHSYPFDPISHG